MSHEHLTDHSPSSSGLSSLRIIAPVFAWILPGLGHTVLGHRRRGNLILTGTALLFLGGLLIGGISVIDYRHDRLWYYGQLLAGPVTPIVNFLHQQWTPPPDPANLSPGTWYITPSFSHANEIGTLMTTVAGLLNLVAILDCFARLPESLPSRSSPRQRRITDSTLPSKPADPPSPDFPDAPVDGKDSEPAPPLATATEGAIP